MGPIRFLTLRRMHLVRRSLLGADGSKATVTGIVTDRDITVRVLAENRDPRTTPIGDICSGELVVLDPDDDLAQAARLVRDRAVRRIPVLRNGTPVGVVSSGDLALEKDARAVLSGVSSPPSS